MSEVYRWNKRIELEVFDTEAGREREREREREEEEEEEEEEENPSCL